MGMDDPKSTLGRLEAVNQWRYRPALRDDSPVPFYLTIQVRFSIQ